MAQLEEVKAKKYIGTYRQYWNYVNNDSDGEHPNTCCGQAAIYSFLRTKEGKQKKSFKSFVQSYPPNIMGGSLGSSWQRIIEVLKAKGYKTAIQYGEADLRTNLKVGPVLVCLDVGAAGWGKPGLHWVTVFGYTESDYYITAWQNPSYRVSRENFKKGWKTWLTIGVSATSEGCYIPYK